jgi:hypothetical protein
MSYILHQDEEDTEWILLNDRDEEDDDLINEESQNDEVSLWGDLRAILEWIFAPYIQFRQTKIRTN